MLVLLHIAIWWEFPGPLSKSLLLAHLGALILWQPIFSPNQRLRWEGAAVFLLCTLGLVTWLNWWLVAFWIIVLTGLIGGRITNRRRDRIAHLVAVLFLLCELLIGVVPPMFALTNFPIEIRDPFGYALLALPAALMLVTGTTAQPSERRVDYLNGLTLASLTSLLALGSLLSMYHFNTDYILALAQAVSGIAILMLVLAWLWTPLRGFSGLEQLWTRYLLNIGTPFEAWLADLSELASQEQQPDEFLRAALARYAALPWVAGVHSTHHESPSLHIGHQTRHYFDFDTPEVEIRTFARLRIGTSLNLHARLLVQLITDFYQAKLRERQLAQKAQVEAVYETGARVTHDIKNLLQSLYAMTTVASSENESPDPEALAMLQRQLPVLTQRLQSALAKLQEPNPAPMERTDLHKWWYELQSRNVHDEIEFHGELVHEAAIPTELFDSAVENFLENARFKRQSQPAIKIVVRAHSQDGQVNVSVSDDGPLPAPALRQELFKGPVASHGGLGIGLFQVAKQAAVLGYSVVCNTGGGCVTFSICGPADSGNLSTSAE